MTESAVDVARAFVEAINRQDVEGLVALMTEGHRFVDSLGNVVEGREKMRAGWAGYFRMVPDYSVAVEETFCDGAVVAMLGRAAGTYAPDGKLTAENRWGTPAAFTARIEDGKVAEWRVYADNEPMRRLMR
jgi:ketosteroid isomerase-like protein